MAFETTSDSRASGTHRSYERAQRHQGWRQLSLAAALGTLLWGPVAFAQEPGDGSESSPGTDETESDASAGGIEDNPADPGEAEEGAQEGGDSADEATLEEAVSRFREGLTLARAGNCAGALAELRRSLSLVERPNTLFNIARCEEELYRYDRAVASYERYLEIAPSDAQDRTAVEATMRSLAGLLGTIEITTNVEAEVWLGDRRVGDAPGEVLIPGGVHAIELRAEGRFSERREVEVAARQTVRLEVEMREVEVRAVLTPRQLSLREPLEDLGAAIGQQRTQQPFRIFGRDAGHRPRAGAPQKLEQNPFRDVIPLMTGGQRRELASSAKLEQEPIPLPPPSGLAALGTWL